MLITYRISRRRGSFVSQGAILLAGIVVNLIANAGVVTVQYMTDYTRAMQALRWLIGSLDVVGFDLVSHVAVSHTQLARVAGSVVATFTCSPSTKKSASLGVNVPRLERLVYFFSCLGVAVTVSVGGAIGFVGLIVPHMVRLLFGRHVRLVLPCSALLGAAFLMLTDAVARTVLGQTELPVGAVTGILGGPLFLWLLHRERRYEKGA